MEKPWVTSISGPTEVQLGSTAVYRVTSYRNSKNADVRAVRWVVYVLERGAWKIHKKDVVPTGPVASFVITNPSLVNKKLLIEAYGNSPEMRSPPGLIVTVKSGPPKIVGIDFRDKNGKALTTNPKYGQTIQAIVSTINLVGADLELSLWDKDTEDDQIHNSNINQRLWYKNTTVERPNGQVSVPIQLTPSMAKLASEGPMDETVNELYLLVRSKLTNPGRSANTISVLQEVPEEISKTEEVTVDGFGPEVPVENGNSAQTVDRTDGVIDVFFAKEEHGPTDEKVGTESYTIPDTGQKSLEKIGNEIKDIIDNKVKKDEKCVKLEELMKTLSALEANLPLPWKEDQVSLAVDLFKLGKVMKKISSGPLSDELFLVAKTVGLEGKNVTFNIKEKDGVIQGSADSILPSLELPLEEKTKDPHNDQEDAPEKTTFKAVVEKKEGQNEMAVVKIKLRPKDDETLQQWEEKVKKGKEGPKFSYKANNPFTVDSPEEAKQIAANIVENSSNDSKLVDNNLRVFAEDIEKILLPQHPQRFGEISYKYVRNIPTYEKKQAMLYLNAKANGKKQYDVNSYSENDDGERTGFFTIGKKCNCEPKIRAYMRMLRVGEGTGEITPIMKNGKKIYVKKDPQKGYTTRFGGKQFSDFSDHPGEAPGSSAAGAYQVMNYTWTDAMYTEHKKNYNISDFSPENQDRFCIILMKHHPGCANFIDYILTDQIEQGTRECGSRIWASLPQQGDNSRYKYKGELQPATPMQEVLEHYEQFLKEEINGKTNLHLKAGFLDEFNIACKCGQSNESNSEWHQPLDKLELRGWYTDTQWTPGKSEFHGRTGGAHDGIDFYAPVGTNIYACIDGEVTYKADPGGYGHRIFLEGKYKNKTYFLMYAHLSSYKTGNFKKGDIIGKTGDSGNASKQSKQNHLHFEVRTKKMVKPSFDPFIEIPELSQATNKRPDKNSQK